MLVLKQLGRTRIVIGDWELDEHDIDPPKGWVRSEVRKCWMHPDVAAAERQLGKRSDML
jgi:hypothetical protein